MSNIPIPENLLKCIENLLIALPQEIEAYSKLPKARPGPVKQLLVKFSNNPLIALLTAAPPTQKGSHSHQGHASELASIKNTLQQLSKAVDGLTKASTPSSKAAKPSKGAAPPITNSPISYLAVAGARLQNASIILDLAQTPSAHAFRPRPVEICGLINDALMTSPHQQVRISAVRWTAKGNLIVIGGHNVMLNQLQLAANTIVQAFTSVYTPSYEVSDTWDCITIVSDYPDTVPTHPLDILPHLTPEPFSLNSLLRSWPYSTH
jgi:hypothetical protein